jgi:hypothetical protein
MSSFSVLPEMILVRIWRTNSIRDLPGTLKRKRHSIKKSLNIIRLYVEMSGLPSRKRKQVGTEHGPNNYKDTKP